jgi:CheY-like chemotaxis protein
MAYTLLLADDSATIQRIVELTFASEDIAVVSVSDGEHAIASLDHNLPDIVLADIGMPGRSGYEVSRYIKNSPPLAHIPVLLLTGAFEPVDQAKALEARCDGILIKPFEPQFVISRVKELLNRPKPGSKEDEVEQYFEELDKAFANLSLVPPTMPDVEAPAESPSGATDEPVQVSDPVESVLANAPVASALLTAPTEPAAVDATAEPAAPSRPIDPAAGDGSLAARPSLAEAFAALLAAERSANGQRGPTPTLVSSARSIPNEDVIERVTRRVLEQMSDAVVREAVTNIVQTTAERLVREEIERIKSNIK